MICQWIRSLWGLVLSVLEMIVFRGPAPPREVAMYGAMKEPGEWEAYRP